MARQVYSFAVTVAAHTPMATPAVTNLALPVLEVAEVRVRVPPGPSGQVGFALAVGGSQIIPYQGGQWIVANDEVLDWPLEDFPESGAWSLMAYNVGSFRHTLQVAFYLALLAPVAAPVIQPLSLVSLSSVGG